MTLEQRGAALHRLQMASEERTRSNERRRPRVESLLNESRDTIRPSPPLPTGLSPSNLVRSRRRAFRPSERLTRSQRERLGQGGTLMPSPSYSTPPPRLTPPLLNPEAVLQQHVAEAREARYRSKRRKLDDGTYEDDSRAITYGHHGQVVPGQLKLDIATCDGGEYSDPQMSVTSWPQNVLQDDATVYCTKSNKCNMLFKHVSGMPFSLTKVVVKAPRSGYDAPIQEGMVFVAMDDDTLVEKTARYEVHYSPKSYRYHRPRFDSLRPSHDYMNSTRSPLSSIDRARYLRNPHPPWVNQIESDPALDSAVVPAFDVVTGDPSDEEEPLRDGPPSPRLWQGTDAEHSFRSYADRYRPVYADSERPAGLDYSAPTSDSEDQEITTLDDILRSGRRLPRSGRESPDLAAPRDSTADDFIATDRRLAPTRMVRANGPGIGAPDPIMPSGYERLSTEPEATFKANTIVSSSEGHPDTIAPHARFFIPRHKSSIAIKFDPPV